MLVALELEAKAMIEKKEKLDHKRSLLFLSFGGLFQGGFQYMVWNVAALESVVFELLKGTF